MIFHKNFHKKIDNFRKREGEKYQILNVKFLSKTPMTLFFNSDQTSVQDLKNMRFFVRRSSYHLKA